MNPTRMIFRKGRILSIFILSILFPITAHSAGLSITTSSLPDITVSVAYSQTLVATGGTSPYAWLLSSGTLPPGLTMSTGGTISGTPTTAGTIPFTVQVADKLNAKATKPLSILVYVSPTITTSTLADGYASATYSQTLAKAGGEAPYSLSVTSGTLPAGLTLATSTGIISGTPTTAGANNFTVQLADSNSAKVNKSLTLVIYAKPSITTSSLQSGSVGATYSQTLAATGGKTPFVWSVTTGILPAGLSLAPSGGVISGTPTTTGASSFTVQVADNNSVKATKSLTITVANLLPVAEAGPNMNVRVGDNAVLDGRTSYDQNGALISYRWSMLAKPTGSAAAFSDNASVVPIFVPDIPGSYVSQLVIYDNVAASLPDNVTVTTTFGNTPPTAIAGRKQSVVTGSAVTLDGSYSFDPDGNAITYSWILASKPSGSSAALSYPSTVHPMFTADRSGNFIATLTVSDGLTYSLPDNVTVIAGSPNAPPIADAGQDQVIPRSTTVQLNGTGSYDPESKPLSYAWTFVSRPQSSTSALDNSVSPAPIFLVDKLGDFVVRLVVNDNQVGSSPDTVVVTSVNIPPVAVASAASNNVPVNTLVSFDGSASHDANGDPITYRWNVQSAPAGSTAAIAGPTSVYPTFTPDLAGNFAIRLIVNDNIVDSTPATVPLTAYIPNVTVPNVTGMTQAVAQSSLATANLTTGTVTQTNHDNVAIGNVISQSPAGGSSVPPATVVNLIVSLGPLMVTVPNVVGMAQGNAQSSITASNLTVGAVTTANSGTVAAGNVISESPAAGSNVVHATSVSFVISQGPAMVGVPVILGMTQSEAQGALSALQLSQGTVTNAWSDKVASGRVISQTPSSGASILQGTQVSYVISQGPEPVVIPPDPATVAPKLDKTVAANVASSTKYLYSGTNPIQTGVVSGVIETKRAAAMRGKVMTRDGQPLTGVVVTIDAHPEFGQTVSRFDGMFDLVANGGGKFVFNYSKSGFLPAKRYVDAGWQEYVPLPDVAMIPFDNQVTTVDLLSPAAPIQVARGSVVADNDGTRQSTLFVAAGTGAQMVFPDGSTRPLSSISIRSTEYTVGPNGPKAMPAPLPPTNGYTYCVELTSDEAMAAGAEGVRFSQPLYHYVENFLGFPVGVPVPVGYYDRNKNAWIPSKNGRVIKILGVNNGIAILDSTGSGLADNVDRLSLLGISEDERRQLSVLYSVGSTLWRVPVPHFSCIDMNFPVGSSVSATKPKDPPITPVVPEPPPGTGCTKNGSIIECQSQVLGEEIPITGTPFTLNYRSDRTPGIKDSKTIYVPITKEVIPPELKRIDLDIFVAGRHIHAEYAAIPNQSYEFIWDGIGFDNVVLHTPQKALIHVAYVFPAYYLIPPDVEETFGLSPSSDIRRVPAPGREVALGTSWEQSVGIFDAREMNLGGWTLDSHHVFDPVNHALYYGNGTNAGSIIGSKGVVSTLAGAGDRSSIRMLEDGAFGPSGRISPTGGIASDDQGNVYFSEGNKIRKIDTDGLVSTFISTKPWGSPPGDGGPATDASFMDIVDMFFASDNCLYILDYADYRIRKIDSNGIITTVVGTGGQGGFVPWQDNVQGTQFALRNPTKIAIGGPDNLLYFIDKYAVWTLGNDNVVHWVAGGGGTYGDEIPATSVCMYPLGLAVGRTGTVYFYDFLQRTIRSFTPSNGLIHSIAGGFPYSYPGNGDGGPAMNAYIGAIDHLAIGKEKGETLYFNDNWYGRIRVLRPDGIITCYAGNGLSGFDGDGGPATGATFKYPTSFTFAPDGSGYLIDAYNYRIRRISSAFPGFSEGEIAVGSAGGDEVFVFDDFGKHLRTLDATTGKSRLEFGYDNTSGTLISITDADNNQTTIERDPSSSTPTALRASGGQRTILGPIVNGYLSSLTRPGGDNVSMEYRADGLLDTLTDYRGFDHKFDYYESGRLKRDTDPVGGFLNLERQWYWTDNSIVLDVFTTTALSRMTHHNVVLQSTGDTTLIDRFPSGSVRTQFVSTDGTRNVTLPDGTQTTTKDSPDSRFGMQSSYIGKSTVQTPAGLSSVANRTKETNLQSMRDPWSITSISQTTNVNGRQYTSIYDNATRSVESTLPSGRKSMSFLDEKGRMVSFKADESFPDLLPVTIAYDNQGRLWKTAHDNDFSEPWIYSYDDQNRLWKITDPLQRTTEYGYDNADRVNTVKSPSSRVFGFEYDGAGNRTRIVMPKSMPHDSSFTPADLPNTYFPPGGPSYSNGFSLDKEWDNTILPGGRLVSASYSPVTGKLLAVNYPEATISYGYLDNDDRVYSVSRSDTYGEQTISFSYDGFLKKTVTFDGISQGEYRYEYDNNFFLTRISTDGAWNVLTRDADGLLTGDGPFTISRNGPSGMPDNVSDLEGRSCSLDGDGQPIMCPAGLLTQGYVYDNVGRLSDRSMVVNGNSIYRETVDVRDLLGRISKRTETIENIPVVFEYAYDLDGQLDNVLRGGQLYEKYGYDNNGNRTNAYRQSPPLSQDNIIFDDQDREAGAPVVFDADGNLASRGNLQYTYSARGELLSVVDNTTGQVTTYAYDGTNRRVARIDRIGAQSNTTQYLYGNLSNPFQVTASRSPDNALTSYFYDGFGAMYALERGDARYYVGSDHLGTPKVVTDNAGNVLRVMAYDSWGVKTYDNNVAFDLPVGFAGGLVDNATNLVRFGYRDYEPGTGRWAAKDPIFHRGGLNLYQYVGNNPVNKKDRNGLGPVRSTVTNLLTGQGSIKSVAESAVITLGAGVVLIELGLPAAVIEGGAAVVAIATSDSTVIDEKGMIDDFGHNERMKNDPEYANEYNNNSDKILNALITSGNPDAGTCPVPSRNK